MSAWLPPLIPLSPLLVALGLLFSGRMIWQHAAPCAVLPALLAVFALQPGVEVEFAWLLLGTRFGLDETTRAFLAFTAVLWGVSSCYALSYLKADPQRRRFLIFFCLSMGGNLGLIMARDVAGFYLFFALMSFSAYGLIVHDGHDRARRAGRIYLTLVILGEVMLFAAFTLMVSQGGALSLAALADISLPPSALLLLVAGFGIKMGALPLHFWLPLAHSAAPTPASAVLSGAMIKAGLLGWLYFLPLGDIALPGWGLMFIAVGIGSAFYGVVVGTVQVRSKTVLAYSSISQMGVITVLIGMGLMRPDAWPALSGVVVIYAVHHALVKGALFLGVGAVANGRYRVTVIAGTIVAALVLAGAPLTSGLVAKLAIKNALHDDPGLVLVLTIAAVGTTLLMARFLYTLRDVTTQHEQRSASFLFWLMLLLIVLLYPWFWSPGRITLLKSFDLSVAASALWPIIAGFTIALVVFLTTRGREKPLLNVVEGDIAVCLESGLNGLGKILNPLPEHVYVQRRRLIGAVAKLYDQAKALDDGSGEALLSRWRVAGLVYLGLLIALLVAFYL